MVGTTSGAICDNPDGYDSARFRLVRVLPCVSTRSSITFLGLPAPLSDEIVAFRVIDLDDQRVIRGHYSPLITRLQTGDNRPHRRPEAYQDLWIDMVHDSATDTGEVDLVGVA